MATEGVVYVVAQLDDSEDSQASDLVLRDIVSHGLESQDLDDNLGWWVGLLADEVDLAQNARLNAAGDERSLECHPEGEEDGASDDDEDDTFEVWVDVEQDDDAGRENGPSAKKLRSLVAV